MLEGNYILIEKRVFEREGKQPIRSLKFGDPMDFVNFEILCPDKAKFDSLQEKKEYRVSISLSQANYRLTAELKNILSVK